MLWELWKMGSFSESYGKWVPWDVLHLIWSSNLHFCVSFLQLARVNQTQLALSSDGLPLQVKFLTRQKQKYGMGVEVWTKKTLIACLVFLKKCYSSSCFTEFDHEISIFTCCSCKGQNRLALSYSWFIFTNNFFYREIKKKKMS
jgi:hypothetical protein